MKTTMLVLLLVLLAVCFSGIVVGEETPVSTQTISVCCDEQFTGDIVRINMATVKGTDRFEVKQGDFIVFTSSGDDKIGFKKSISEMLFGVAAKTVIVKADQCTWVRVQCYAEPGDHDFDSVQHPFPKPMGGPTIVVCKPGQPCGNVQRKN